MKRLYCILAVLALTLGITQAANCQAYRIDWYSINSGGGFVSDATYRLDSSLGQSAAGFVKNATNLHWIGFWAGQMPDPVVVSTIRGLKSIPNGAYVTVAGKIATSSETDFTGFFYVEEINRSNAVRVAAPAGAMTGLLRGKVVNVIGTLGTTPAGERQLVSPIVVIVTSSVPLMPLGMTNRSVGGGDYGTPPSGQYGVADGFGLNNVGLLVTTWGRVISAGTGYAVIDDGSGTPVRIDTSVLASPPEEDEYVSVIGISSLHKPGPNRLRMILPRDDADIIRP